jgi:hypothetical protein
VIFVSIPFQHFSFARKITAIVYFPFTLPNPQFNPLLAPFAGLLCPQPPGPITIEERTHRLWPLLALPRTVRAGLTDAEELPARKVSIMPRVDPGIATECQLKSLQWGGIQR